jgi:anaerobic ribonucleoside-triphosphate reductase
MSLSNRLEISLQLNEDLKSKSRDQIHPSESTMDKQFQELSSALQQATDLKGENETQSNLLSPVLEAAQSRFEIVFSTAIELRKYFLLPDIHFQANDTSMSDRIRSETERELIELKQRLKRERSKRKQINNKIHCCERDFKQRIQAAGRRHCRS